MQRRYCTTNKELLAVVMVIELFRYYLTGRHFTVVTDHASLIWLCNFAKMHNVWTLQGCCERPWRITTDMVHSTNECQRI